ncbi:bifunctional diaminohydroxyphosphoribosylaminopyrimidine deaminase/5-amino-6-(5-phosphoribosylamino)uracil reductase RibD [Candidatus Woesearchaeota archaeon]|nr:bifunctional diaminohydroxyphosphoribosylaminopyrimidine deaminase/5-amino-6-(5-phosphoribosylamino)uracil reductase RibD [Candidatus Woesearchaeota archaeon]
MQTTHNHMHNYTKNDYQFMHRALELAKQGNPSPNPYVGCVIAKNSRILVTGYHNKHGEMHAEIAAINNAMKRLNKKELFGSTFYLTMEPCTHYGKTPPCIDKVIAAKPRKVIIASLDQNPITNGKGFAALKKAGIKVKLGLLDKEADELNRVFNKYITTQLPYVFLKSAMSQNRIIAWGNRCANQITGDEARNFSHHMRNKCDAILVGINTVLNDDPQLTCRLHIDKKRDPKRIILDSRLRIPLSAKVLADNNVIIFCKNGYDADKYKQLSEKGVEIIVLQKESIDLLEVLAVLGEKNISSVLIEGGATVYKNALHARIVDEMILLVAPFTVAEENALAVFDEQQFHFKLQEMHATKFGNDLLVTGKVKYN